MLHTVSKSPFDHSAFETCLRFARKGAAVLLIEDAVYGAARGGAVEAQVKQALGRAEGYARAPDLEARGMRNRLIEGVKLVDYGGFVDLVARHKTSQSWL